MRHALILSGGGALGGYEAGAAPILLEYYANTASPITIVSGTSVGALNAAALVQGAAYGDSPYERARQAGNLLIEIWSRIRPGDVIRQRWFGRSAMAWRLLRGRALFDASPLRRLIDRTLDPDVIADSPWKLLVHAVDIDRKQQVTASNRSPRLREAVLASASIPVAFDHVRIGGLNLVDGGVVANTPIAAAIKAGAERITIVYLDHERIAPRTLLGLALEDADEGRDWHPIELGQRAIETMMTAHLERDLRMVHLVNQLVATGLGGAHRSIELRVLRPTSALGPDGSTLNFDHEFVRGLVRRGAEDAEQFIRTGGRPASH